MNNLSDYVGKIVNISCVDGKEYKSYYVYGFTIWYNDNDREEDSIDLLKNKDDNSGITLYKSEINSIEIVT